MGIDLGCPASISDPAGYFAPWIADGDVHWSDAQRGWAVIGHAAVADAFRDAERLSADRITTLERVAARRPAAFAEVVELLSSWMIFRDPPAHTRLRAPVRTAFTPRRVTALEPVVEAIVDEALDTVVASGRDGVGDLTEHVARPVPALVIGALLGVEPEHRAPLQRWSDDLAEVVFSLRPSSTPTAPTVAAARAFRRFFGDLVETAPDRDDGGLVAAMVRLESDFEVEELVGMCTLLLFAGHETTTSLIQNAVATLLQQPALADRLRQTPELVPGAVEEFLRVQGPARTMVRKAAVTHRRGEHQVVAGDTVYLSIAAANHDARVFEEPGYFVETREPNPHLGFGWGLHHCLGAQLARVETTVVIRRLLERFAELRPAGSVPSLAGGTMGFRRGVVRIHTDIL